MKIAVVQFCPILFETEKNVEKIIDFINKIEAEIILFPELATSGYFFISRDELSKVAISSNSEILSNFQNISTDQNKIVCFGFPEKQKDKYYNSAILLFPDKNKSKIYRKTHLFYKESLIFEPGDTGFWVVEEPIFNIRIGVMICYDWRFPEASRTLALKGADLILCPSNLVTEVWHKVMPIRAFENKVYLAVANRTGLEERNNEKLLFKGESAIYSYNGETLTKADAETEVVLYTTIYPEKTRNKSFNEYNDIFQDRRPNLYFT